MLTTVPIPNAAVTESDFVAAVPYCFLIQRENDIFPAEVKSEANTSGRSLKKFKELFMADQTDRLIGAALHMRIVSVTAILVTPYLPWKP